MFRGLLCSLLSRGVPPPWERIEGVAYPTTVNVEFDGAAAKKAGESARQGSGGTGGHWRALEERS